MLGREADLDGRVVQPEDARQDLGGEAAATDQPSGSPRSSARSAQSSSVSEVSRNSGWRSRPFDFEEAGEQQPVPLLVGDLATRG